MSDFITRLAQRQLGQIASVMPRLPEVFAPPAAPALPPSGQDVTAAAAAPLQNNPPPTSVANSWLEPDSVATTTAASSNVSSKPAPARLAVAPVIAATRDAGQKALDEPPATFSETSSRPEIVPVRLPSAMPAIANDRSLPLPPESARNYPVSESNEVLALAPSGVSAEPPSLITVERSAVPAPPRLASQRHNRGGVAVLERGGADREPPIQVNIGRIEVTAVQQAAPPKRAPTPRKPAMSLDEYLARRQRRES